jgi:hypothetical protein
VLFDGWFSFEKGISLEFRITTFGLKETSGHGPYE